MGVGRWLEGASDGSWPSDLLLMVGRCSPSDLAGHEGRGVDGCVGDGAGRRDGGCWGDGSWVWTLCCWRSWAMKEGRAWICWSAGLLMGSCVAGSWDRCWLDMVRRTGESEIDRWRLPMGEELTPDAVRGLDGAWRAAGAGSMTCGAGRRARATGVRRRQSWTAAVGDGGLGDGVDRRWGRWSMEGRRVVGWKGRRRARVLPLVGGDALAAVASSWIGRRRSWVAGLGKMTMEHHTGAPCSGGVPYMVYLQI
ncbi:hypothetical protein ACLOJK_018594 [Asimina triloba]